MTLSTLAITLIVLLLVSPKRGLIPLETIVLLYIPMIILFFSLYGTLIAFPTILPSNKLKDHRGSLQIVISSNYTWAQHLSKCSTTEKSSLRITLERAHRLLESSMEDGYHHDYIFRWFPLLYLTPEESPNPKKNHDTPKWNPLCENLL